MPNIFIYEEMVVHNGYGSGESSMLTEGRAMLKAVAEDFRSISEMNVNIATKQDDERESFFRALGKNNYSLIIAPEGGSKLDDRLQWASLVPAKSLNCTLEATRLTADKLKMFYHWRLHDVWTPLTIGTDCPEWTPPRFPRWCVVKDRYGSGSDRIFLSKNDDDFENAMMHCVASCGTDPLVQDYWPGRAASIAFLVGPRQTLPLRATFQLLSADGRYHYQGGHLPIRPELEKRVIEIAWKSIECVRGLRGYVGVDVVVNEELTNNPFADAAIEINPRLTTSYVGLRALADFNIAQAMIDVVEGRPVDYVKWKPGRVQFWPDGRVEYDPAAAAWE